MRLPWRKLLLFLSQFILLFVLTLALYSQALSRYERWVLGVANAVAGSLTPPTSMASVSNDWECSVRRATGDRRIIWRWNTEIRHLVLLSLAFVPALLLATPAPWLTRLRLLGLGCVLLFGIHVLAVVGLMRFKLCLIDAPGTFHCLWGLRLAYSSGQLLGAAVWGVLTWQYWLPTTGER